MESSIWHGATSGIESIRSFFPFLPSSLWRPLIFCMPCLVRLSFISSLNGPCAGHNKLCHSILDIMDHFLSGNDH